MHHDNGLKTLKFHHLEHLVDASERFGTNQVLISSPYEHYNFMVKHAYASTSETLQESKRKTVRNLHSTLNRERVSDVCSAQQPSG